MTTKSIIFSIPNNIKIKLSIPSNILFSEREDLLLKAYVPGISFTSYEEQTNSKTDLIIQYYSNKTQKIEYDKSYISIYDDWSNEIPLYFFHLIYSISHHLLLKKKFYTLHTACITKNSNNALLIGHTGVGKTTIMLNLLNNYNFKMFSSNKTLVKFTDVYKLEAIAGTTSITFKASDQDSLGNMIGKTIKFVNRLASNISDEYYTNEKKLEINRIYIIRLNPAVQECLHLNEFESMINLYPFFFDYFNSGIILFNGNAIYDGDPINIRMKNNLLSLLKKSLNSIEIYSLIGSLDYITGIINTHHAK